MKTILTALLFVTTSTFAQKADGVNLSLNTDIYSGLSDEGKAFLKIYQGKYDDVAARNYLQNLYDDWKKKGQSSDFIIQSYANMVTEIYAKNQDAAFDIMMKIPFDVRTSDVRNKLKPEIQATIRQKAQAVVQGFENAKKTATNTTPNSIVQPKQPETVQPKPINPLEAYIGKVYHLDNYNPYGKTANYKTKFYVFGYEGQKLKGIAEYENSTLRTKTTVTINAPYFYEYAQFNATSFQGKSAVGTCSKDIAICSQCSGNGNSTKQKDVKKTRTPDHFDKIYETTYRTYYPCGRCNGKGILNK